MTPSVDAQALLHQAIDCHQNGDLASAEQFYRATIAACPELHVAHHLLALLVFGKGDADEAESRWRRACALAPGEAIYRNNLGEVLRRRGGSTEAEALFAEAVRLKPDFVEARNNLGLALLERKEFEAAIACFGDVLLQRPDFFQAMNNIGNSLKNLHRHEEAQEWYRRAVETRPDFAEGWNNLGLALHEVRDYEAAGKAFDTARACQPGLLDAYRNHVRLLKDIGEYETGRQLCLRALELLVPGAPRAAEFLTELGDCYKALGDLTNGKAAYREAMKCHADHALYRANDLSFSYAQSDGYYRLAAPAPARSLRVAVLAPGDHYLNMLWGMKGAFEERGVDCLVGWPLLGPDAMRGLVETYHPDLVIEINRTRDQAAGLPSSVLHICWAQDGTHAFGQDATRFGGSNRVYFMAQPETIGYDPGLLLQTDIYDLLPPGADLAVYHPVPGAARSFDFAFAGYIPPPPSNREEFTVIRHRGKPMGMTWPEMEALFRDANIRQWSVGDCAYESIRLHLARHLGWREEDTAVSDDAYRNFTWLMRTMDRADMLKQALRVSSRLIINGPDTWEKWPEFVPHYHGMLHDAKALADSYRSAELVLHNGVSALHPRTFECLACGAALLINRCYTDDKPGSIRNYFQPGEHYLEYEIDKAEDVFRSALADKSRLEQLRRAAVAEVAAHHTWRHRIDKLLADLGQGIAAS